MTRTHELLGDVLDVSPARIEFLRFLQSREHAVVVDAERQAREAGDAELAQQLVWEDAALDVNIEARSDKRFFHDRPYADWVKVYGIAERTRPYMLERARETAHPLVRAHHLEFALRTMSPTGREWVDLMRETAAAYRALVDHITARLPDNATGTSAHAAVDAMTRIAELIALPGVARAGEAGEWACWIASTARALRDAPWPEADYNRPHRWPFLALRHLTVIPADQIEQPLRDAALAMVGEAYEFFSKAPLADLLTHDVAAAEAALRRHFGEQDTHRTMVRRQYDALVAKATFFADNGNRLGAALTLHEARKIAAEHGQYFSASEVAGLHQRERESNDAAVAHGDFTEVEVGVFIPGGPINFVKETADATVDELLRGAIKLVPNITETRSEVEQDRALTPLSSLFSSTTVDDGRVVHEGLTDEQRFKAEVERQLLMHAHINGRAVADTLALGVRDLGLTVAHVMRGLAALPLKAEQFEMIEHGIGRALADDTVGAVYTLVPILEDTLRTLLRTAGFDTAKFEVVDQDSSASRTDERTLGALLRLVHPDGRTVETFLGSDLWHYFYAIMASQSGLNLRNKVGHGLARRRDCSRWITGATVHLYFALAHVASAL